MATTAFRREQRIVYRWTMRWFVSRNGETVGPVEEREVTEWVRGGMHDATIRDEFSPAWIPLAQSPFAALLPQAAAAAVQPPPHVAQKSESVTLKQAAVVILVAIGIGTWMLMSTSHGSDKVVTASSAPAETPVAPAPATADPTPVHAGDLGHISSKSRVHFVFHDVADYKHAVKLAAAKDKDGWSKLVQTSGWALTAGTAVRVIDRDLTGGMQIRIVDGDHAGDDAWTEKEFVVP